MTPEERDRLVRLERDFEHIKNSLDTIVQDVAEMKRAALMGKGALVVLMRIGAVLVVVGGWAMWGIDRFLAHH